MKRAIFAGLLAGLAAAGQVFAEATIHRYIGPGLGDYGPAANATFTTENLRGDAEGNLYFTDRYGNQVRKIDVNGIITTIAGSRERIAASSGDGGLAVNASLNRPVGLAISPSGEIFVSERDGRRIRKIGRNGIITTIAGNGQDGFAGDGVPALGNPIGVLGGISFDGEGNLLVAAIGQRRVRRIGPDGMITTVAGTGEMGGFVEPGPALDLALSEPVNVEAGRNGEFYIVEDVGQHLIKVDAQGVMAIIAPDSPQPDASAFWLDQPRALSVDAQGRLLVTDEYMGSIWLLDPDTGPRRVAGGGYNGGANRGDGGLATNASVAGPNAISWLPDGSFVFSQMDYWILWRVDAEGIMDFFAGQGGGDGAPLAEVALGRVASLAQSPDGDLYIGESGRIRRVSRGASATTTPLPLPRYTDVSIIGHPNGLAIDSRGRIFFREGHLGSIRVIDENGAIGYVPGGNSASHKLMIDPAGQLIFTREHEVKRLDPDTGIATTIAGRGRYGFSGDGGPASLAQFYNIGHFVLDPNGGMILADHGNARIRRISPEGIVTTIAGTGVRQSSSETGLATDLPVGEVTGLALSPGGRIYFTDGLRIREISPDGVVRTIAGTGQPGHAGDGGAAIDASFSRPSALLLDQDGSLLVGDDRRIRRIILDSPEPQLPQISIADTSVTEGDSGHLMAAFSVSLSYPPVSPVQFRVVAQPITAAVGSDYLDPHGDLRVIPAGQVSTTVNVPIVGDRLEESTEEFQLALESVAGAWVKRGSAIGVIVDNDDGVPPPEEARRPVARHDRVLVSIGGGPILVDVLANDDIDSSARAGVSVRLTTTPSAGFAEVVDAAIRYVPSGSGHGEDRFSYRVCDGMGGCADAEVIPVLRPVTRVDLVVNARSGNWTQAISGLPEMPAIRFRSTPLVPATGFVLDPAPDDTPERPWDGAQGQAFRLFPLARFGVEDSVDHMIHVDLYHNTGNGPLDLYLGLDSNGDGQPQEGEVICVDAGSERANCDARISGSPPTAYWVMLHNRGVDATGPFLVAFDVPMVEGDGTLVATGPGMLPQAASFDVLLSWNDLSLFQGGMRLGYVELEASPGQSMGVFPVRIHQNGNVPEPVLLTPSRPVSLRLDPGSDHRKIVLDVPEGSSSLSVSATASFPGTEFRLVHGGVDQDHEDTSIQQVPSASLAAGVPSSAGITVSAPAPGRWYVVPSNLGARTATVTLTAEVDGVAPTVRPGSYFNAARRGHGLFLYPAGNQWAGLWYAYANDGRPTWYYLQGVAPGANGVWAGDIYRAAWHGTSNVLTKVGLATVTPTGPDAFTFSYTLDGLSGSEPMAALGRGCPTLAGLPQDLSSHWFNPQRAGTGYSVQLWEQYEYLAAFVYDGRGEPRFLAGERSGFGGAETVLALEQLRGACPTCAWMPPVRADVGTLLRRITNGGLSHIELDVEYTDGVPGTWTAIDGVELLGGASTTQGCAP